ncbi:hypothetical protein [Streptomyces flaveolus]|uniref:hypothetical protein n=1 Tax=Streptomyces flaveolus TaxID=67297 RepID=UPI0033C8378A
MDVVEHRMGIGPVGDQCLRQQVLAIAEVVQAHPFGGADGFGERAQRHLGESVILKVRHHLLQQFGALFRGGRGAGPTGGAPAGRHGSNPSAMPP